MSVQFHLDAHWQPRGESALECAEHLAAMLMALASLHPAFASWNKQGQFRNAANHPFCAMPPSVEELARIIAKKPNERGFSFGYSINAWNGKDPSYGLTFSVRAGDERDLYNFPNRAKITLPVQEAANADLLNPGVLKSALLAMIAAWNPDWADLCPWAYWKRWLRSEPLDLDDGILKRPGGYLPRITSGWMTYLCADYARRITPPRGIEIEPVAGGGLILLATREVFNPGNPAHDAAADAIQEALLPLQNLPHKETN